MRDKIYLEVVRKVVLAAARVGKETLRFEAARGRRRGAGRIVGTVGGGRVSVVVGLVLRRGLVLGRRAHAGRACVRVINLGLFARVLVMDRFLTVMRDVVAACVAKTDSCDTTAAGLAVAE